MALNPEHFESLEAYLDGALDAAGKAQVDRQLASDPALRLLVTELSEMRSWVAALPRTAAPVDLVETFQGQLERSSLLGDAGGVDTDVVLRIHHWSHYVSVAAVVFLALGLGMVIYKVLPNKPTNTIVAVAGPSTPSPDREAEAIAPADGARRDELPRASTLEDGKKDAGVSVAGGGVGGGGFGSGGGAGGFAGGTTGDLTDNRMHKRSIGSGETPALTEGVGPTIRSPINQENPMAKGTLADRPQVTLDEVRELQQRLARGAMATKPSADEFGAKVQVVPAEPNLADEPIVLLVKAQDPKLANQDVTEYLRVNNLAYAVIAGNANGFNELRGAENNILALQTPASHPNSRGYDVNKSLSGLTNDSKPTNLPSNPTTNVGVTGVANAGNNSFINQAAANTATTTPANGDPINGVDNNNYTNRGGPSQGTGLAQAQNGGLNYGANRAQGYSQNVATQPAGPEFNYGGGRGGLNGIVATGAANGVINAQQGGRENNSTNVFAGNNTYRVMLNVRQQSELNDFIAKRGNQWSERHIELRGVVATSAAMDNESAVKDKFRYSNTPADRQPATREAGMTAKLESQSAPRPPAASLSTTGPFPKDGSVKSGAAATDVGGVTRSSATKLSDNIATGAAKEASKRETSDLAASRPGERLIGADAVDEPHEVLIVVNEQPVILPTTLPAPATAPTEK